MVSQTLISISCGFVTEGTEYRSISFVKSFSGVVKVWYVIKNVFTNPISVLRVSSGRRMLAGVCRIVRITTREAYPIPFRRLNELPTCLEWQRELFGRPMRIKVAILNNMTKGYLENDVGS